MTITIIQTTCNLICFACTLFMTHKALKLAHENAELTQRLKWAKLSNDDLFNCIEKLKKRQAETEKETLKLTIENLKEENNELRNKKENN